MGREDTGGIQAGEHPERVLPGGRVVSLLQRGARKGIRLVWRVLAAVAAGMVRFCISLILQWGAAMMRLWDYAVRGGLRRFFAGAPLLMPLLAVLGSLGALYGGAWWWVAVAGVLCVCGVYRLVRIGVCAVLCAAVAFLHGLHMERDSRAMAGAAAGQGYMELRGRVVRDLERGCVVRTESGPCVVLRGERSQMPFELGDDVAVSAAPTVQAAPPVEGMFDPAAWMRGQGIALSLDYVEGCATGHGFSFADIRRAGLAMRRALEQRLMPAGEESDPRRQVLCAMVLGDKQAAAEETLESFRRGGCLHVFAVSGLHVALVFGILWKLLLFLRVRPAAARPVVLLLVGAYVVVTGCAIPAFRAYLMLAVLMLGCMLRRRVGMANTWSFAALLVLLAEPFRIHDAGFLLSFIVYAGICLGVWLCRGDRPVYSPDPYLPRRLWNWGQRRLAGMASGARACVVVSVSAWLVSLPVTLGCFHTFTAFAALTNICIALLLLPLMLCGLLTLVLGGVPLLGPCLELAALKCAGGLLAVTGWFGGLAGAYLPAHAPAEADSAMVFTRRYGGSVCVLGNPGLLINCGNAASAALNVQPALFHSGCCPAALLVTGKKASLGGGADELLRRMPGLRVLRYDALPQRGCRFSTPGGTYSIYPAADTPNRYGSTCAPVVLWQHGTRRVLYVGDASVNTLLSLPEDARRADIVILGCHPLQPVQDPELLLATGARRIILLPGTALSLRAQDLAPQAALQVLRDETLYRL